MAKIEISDLRKAYEGQVAVAGLSLSVDHGELLVLLGPSGCGKTTTLNCIAGLEVPDSGRIRFGEEDVTGLPPHQRNVAMVFQSSVLYPHMTAAQNIAMSLRRSSLSRDEITDRIDEAARIVGVEALLHKMPSQLSGGERQRVATAKAIVRHPTVFLLDEPLAALDAALRMTLRAELANLQKRLATTMIMVTHDQVEAMTIGDRIAIMKDGEVQQVGTPDEIYNRPQTLFVASFVGSPPMNFFTGEIHAAEDAMKFTAGNLVATLPEHWRACVDRANGGRLTLGVRPQHVRISREARNGALMTTVFAVEHLGKESIVIMEDRQQNRIRAIVDPAYSTGVGDRLFVTPDVGHAVLFDPGSANAISHSAKAPS